MKDAILSEDQMTVIHLLQEFYTEYQVHPSMRVLIQLLEKQWNKEKANSLYLYKLFPEGPIKQASLLGGLPKPTKCL
jgi:tRNA 2-thiouridine synthesizing protein E